MYLVRLFVAGVHVRSREVLSKRVSFCSQIVDVYPSSPCHFFVELLDIVWSHWSNTMAEGFENWGPESNWFLINKSPIWMTSGSPNACDQACDTQILPIRPSADTTESGHLADRLDVDPICRPS